MSVDAGAPLGPTIGALFVGVILSMGCWGASVIQAFHYYERYPNDRQIFKCLVTVVFATNTAHQILITVVLYKYLVSEYGNASYLRSSPSELNITTVLNCIIILLVQSFFVWRIYSLSKRCLPLFTVLGTLVIGQFVIGIVYFELVHDMKTFRERYTKHDIIYANSTASAIGDAAIAGALVCLLHRSRTGFKRNERMINRLIMFAIRAGFPTCVCAVAGAITISVIPKSLIYLIFYFLGGRLYTNTLIAILNSRQSQHGDSSFECTTNGNAPVPVDALSLTRLRVRPETVSSFIYSQPSPHVVSIRIDTETEQHIFDHNRKCQAIRESLCPITASSAIVQVPPNAAITM